MEYSVQHAKARPAGASPWICAVVAALVTGAGMHAAWLILSEPRPMPVAVTALPVLTTPATFPTVLEPERETQTPASGNAGQPTAPPPPVAPAAAAGAPADDVGPEWTRQPLPPLNGALLPHAAAAPPSPRAADSSQPGGPSGSGVPPGTREAIGRDRTGVPDAARQGAPGAASTGPRSDEAQPTGAPAPEAGAAPAGAREPAERRHGPEVAQAAVPTPEAPLQIQLGASRGREARYHPGEWIVLRLGASAPCFARIFRIGASGEVKQALAPEEKPAGFYGVALKAGEHGLGEEWVVAVAAVQRLSEAQLLALLRARPATADGAAVNSLLAHLKEMQDAGETPAPSIEPWQYAVAVTRYEVVEPSPASLSPQTVAPARADSEDGAGR